MRPDVPLAFLHVFTILIFFVAEQEATKTRRHQDFSMLLQEEDFLFFLPLHLRGYLFFLRALAPSWQNKRPQRHGGAKLFALYPVIRFSSCLYIFVAAYFFLRA